ncbi:MAG TPA: hypothetical protein VNZ22_12310 [Bacillota bacterium]|nr:hypothetical protein [Bacillota bacterium]
MITSAPVRPKHFRRPEEAGRARLVKIDVEGAEAAVLAGRPGCELLVEIHPEPLRQPNHSAEQVLEVFGQAGYHPYVLENDYDASAYLWPRSSQALPRFQGTIDNGSNIFSSRSNREAL